MRTVYAVILVGIWSCSFACDDTTESNSADGATFDAVPDTDAQVDASTPAPLLPIANEEFRISLSPSPWATTMFANSISYEDGERVATNAAELIDLFVAHGANEVYARINTRNAFAGGPDRRLATALARAGQAQTRGLPLNIELGLFRSYGEITCQTPPDFSDYPAIQNFFPVGKSQWHELTLAEMEDLLTRYGVLVASAVKQTNVTVNVWDLGNEVDLGTAGLAPPPFPGNPCDGEEGGAGWYRAPDAVDPDIGLMNITTFISMTEAQRIAWLQQNIWPYEARLFAAVAAGIRSVEGYQDAKVATHLSGAFLTPTWVNAFYDAMELGGFAVDEYAFSYYPSASEDPDAALANVKAIVGALQIRDPSKGVFLAEFGYPSGAPSGPYASWDNPPSGFALSEQDQARFLQQLASWGRASGLAGIRPFAPELIPAWEPFSMFHTTPEGTVEVKAAIDAIWIGASDPDPMAL